MQNETRTVVPKRSSPKIRESRVPREYTLVRFAFPCRSSFSNFSSPFFSRTKIVSYHLASPYFLLPLSSPCTSFLLHFKSLLLDANLRQEDIFSVIRISNIYIYMYRVSLKEKSKSLIIDPFALTLYLFFFFFPVQYDSKSRHSLSVEITKRFHEGLGTASSNNPSSSRSSWTRLSWAIDASTSASSKGLDSIFDSRLFPSRSSSLKGQPGGVFPFLVGGFP